MKCQNIVKPQDCSEVLKAKENLPRPEPTGNLEEDRKKIKCWYQKIYYRKNIIKSRLNEKRKYRSFNGHVKHLYFRMKNSKNGPTHFSYSDFLLWVNKHKTIFMKLHNLWKKSGFKKGNAPSINRIDDYKGYYLDNIEIITWNENNIKGIFCDKRMKKICKPVKIMKGDQIKIFKSRVDAAKFLNVTKNSINYAVYNKSTVKKWKVEKVNL